MFASVIKVDLIKDHKVEINYGPDKSVKHRPDKMARFEGVLGLLVRESSDESYSCPFTRVRRVKIRRKRYFSIFSSFYRICYSLQR